MSEKILYDYAISLLGAPYFWGGDDPMQGWDCSGLVQELLKAVGMAPGGDCTAQGLYDYFKGQSSTEKKFGSLAFYGEDAQRIRHVAFLLNDSLVIEAGGGGGATTSRDAAIRQNAYVRVRPANHRRDLIHVLRPLYRGL